MDNENLKLLELALENDILSSSDMEKIRESMKKKTLEKLKNELKPLHPYTIRQNEKDQRWRTRVPDKSCKSGLRMIVKTSEQDLYTALADYYGLEWYDDEDKNFLSQMAEIQGSAHQFRNVCEPDRFRLESLLCRHEDHQRATSETGQGDTGCLGT